MNVRVLRESGAVGDLVRTLVVARGLKEKYPGCRLFFYSLESNRELVETSPYADVFVSVPFKKKRYFNQPLDEKRFPYLRSDVPFDLTVDLLGPACRYENQVKGDVRKGRTEIWCEAGGVQPLSYCPDIHLAAEAREWADRLWRQHGLATRTTIGVQPFSTSESRNWPKERWITLAQRLLDTGHVVLVLDGHKSRARGVPGVSLLGASIGRAAAAVRRLDFMVAPDSGFFHLAGAQGVKTLGLFGSTNGGVTGKHYPRAAYLTVIPRELTCRPPCYRRRERGHRKACDSEGCAAMKAISVDMVLSKLWEMGLEGAREARVRGGWSSGIDGPSHSLALTPAART